jgi:hypothetical protein
VEHQVDERHESGNSLKAAFMLVREVSAVADMVRRGWDTILIFVENCQETSERDTANKHSLELCASIVLIF